MKKLQLLLPAALLVAACSPAPQAIDYGNDLCAHCQMAIVDKPFAAEVVTQKGKVFKFDAIECMGAYLGENGENDFAMMLVQDYTQPGEWHDAVTSYYLVSEGIASPMGAYLSAYQDEAGAKQMQAEKGGMVYNWEELKIKLSAQ